ncbi:hypothetical protein [Magnetofaba australis]|uniref:Uncharacterized protein n=1 Tax=Magnetofaba australis IT-1 TaxID=1434232 RepID=A0A1Y2K2K6_9PROT|nr:hypothetical protein [Magnetofaba australis]OSM00422.1 hypothetical protein MAIT1_00938 [Magnetofaba australis IT-1]
MSPDVEEPADETEAHDEAFAQSTAESYRATRQTIIRELIDYSLLSSYQKFRKNRVEYPFVPRATLRPGSVVPTKEHELHNHALVVLLANHLPKSLRKHFRCREGNRVIKKNIAAVAPDLPNLEAFDPASKKADHPDFPALVRMLIPLDFALLVQRDEEDPEHYLTHFHVKIERLTDMALRAMALHLGYVERSLYEQGESFVDQFERKFFEYFNYYHNAAGRRSASALAAQLLTFGGQCADIFSTSQQDRRFTVLSCNAEKQDVEIEQYILLALEDEECKLLKGWGKEHGLNIRNDYLVSPNGPPVAVLRVRYQHTEAATPNPDGGLKEWAPREKWIRISEEALIPLKPEVSACINYPVAYKRNEGIECIEWRVLG